ncbi:MAG: hypothetical protein IH626_17635 [Rhodospirillales bacterium]|nr:hypothetical protein [Rhodospirillales bacterium]
MSERYAWCLFCDDIRAELGGKYSLMGLWGPRFACPAYPFTLPSLGLAVYFRTAPDEDIRSLKIWLESPSDQKAEFQVNMEDVPGDLPEEFPSRVTILHLRMFNFVIQAPGWMKAFVEADGERYYAGAVYWMRQEAPGEQGERKAL